MAFYHTKWSGNQNILMNWTLLVGPKVSIIHGFHSIQKSQQPTSNSSKKEVELGNTTSSLSITILQVRISYKLGGPHKTTRHTVQQMFSELFLTSHHEKSPLNFLYNRYPLEALILPLKYYMVLNLYFSKIMKLRLRYSQ